MLGIEITAQISCRERSWISLHVVMPLTMKGHIIHSRSMFKLCEERHTLSRPVDNLRSTGEMCQFYMMIINLSAMEQYTHSLLCLSYSCIQRILVVRPSQTVGHLCMRMSGACRSAHSFHFKHDRFMRLFNVSCNTTWQDICMKCPAQIQTSDFDPERSLDWRTQETWPRESHCSRKFLNGLAPPPPFSGHRGHVSVLYCVWTE